MTEAKFRKSLKNRAIWSIFIVLVGVVLLYCSRVYGNWESQEYVEHLSYYYLGISCGFMGGGLCTLIMNICIMNSEKLFRARYRKETDERNILISAKAWVLTAKISILAALLSTMFIMNLPQAKTIIWTVLYVVYAQLLLFCIIYKIYQKKV